MYLWKHDRIVRTFANISEFFTCANLYEEQIEPNKFGRFNFFYIRRGKRYPVIGYS